MPRDHRRWSFSVPLPLILLALLVAGDAARRGAEARPFLPSPVYQVSNDPRLLVVGDFDGDGRADVAVANSSTFGDTVTVSLLLNEGGGLYRSLGAVYASGATSFSPVLAAGDVNLDGKLDLVLETGSGSSWLAQVLLGQGNGAFTPVAPNLALPGPLSLVDCNADGKLDLLVSSGSGVTSQLRVWIGAGNGTFSGLTAFPAPAGIDFGRAPVAVADLNGDRVADVVVNNATATASVVFRGNTTGTFTQGQTIASTAPSGLAVLADASGDGLADFIVQVSGSPFQLRAWRGHGDGTFDVSPFWTQALPAIDSLAVGDLNRDGSPDLATLSAGKVRTWLAGGGTFVASSPFPVGLQASQALIGDFDGTGGLDLAVAGSGSNTVTFVLARPDGTWVPTPLPSPTGSAIVQDVAVADFNGDGRADLAALHHQPAVCEEESCPWGEVEVRLAQPGGGFAISSTSITGNFPSGPLLVADLDLDGHLDVVTVDLVDDGSDAVIDPGTLTLLRGHGDGTFDLPVTLPAGQWPQFAAAGDLDHDGDIDLVEANGYSNTVTVLLRSGAGTYTPQAPIPVGRTPVQVDVVDVDGDNTPDLVVTARGNIGIGLLGEVAWLKGHGNATFDPRVVLAPIENPSGLAAADLDGDGDVDFVVASQGNSDPSDPGGSIVLLHQAGNTFAASAPYQAGTQPQRPRLADFNGDGALDLYLETSERDLAVFPGMGNGTFRPGERFAGLGCGVFRAGRLPGDGDLDLFGTCADLAVFENEADQNPDLRVLDNTHLFWTPDSLIGSWDVIRGSAAVLRSTGGNFGVAVQACLQNDGPLHSLAIATVPPGGDAFFYLVRTVRPNGSPGSYDGEVPRQAAPRDAAIAASASACP
jgi:hypothetical protein